MLMGQSDGSDWRVRPVGHTDGSNQEGQSDGSDQLVSQVCHMLPLRLMVDWDYLWTGA